MSEIDWSKAPEGATHYAPAFEGFRALWAKLKDGRFLYHTGEGDWYWGAQPLENEAYIERPKSWQGTGLPPVGCKCEIEEGETGKWIVGTVLAHGIDEGKEWAIVQCDDAVWMGEAHEFRPIRTQEQIEVEERNKAIAKMCSIVRDTVGCGVNVADMAALYDAGYRKQEPKQ